MSYCCGIRNMKSLFKIRKENIKIWIVLVIASLLYVLPVILANRYYNDDLSRALTGQLGWNGDGRPLMQLLLQYLGGGSGLAVDIAPLPLILAVIMLSYSLIVYAQNVLLFVKTNVILTLALFMFILNPFMMFAWPYKFDIVGMAMSLGLLLLLFAVPKFGNWWINLIVSIATGIIVMMIYQPSIGLAVGLCFMGVFLWLLGKRDINELKCDVIGVLGAGIGALIYKVFIVGLFIVETSGDWRYNASQIVVVGDSAIKQILINLYNMLLYIYRYYKNNMSSIFKVIIVLGIVIIHGTIVVRVYLGKYSDNDNRTKRILKAIAVLIMPVVITMGICAPLTLLNDISSRGRLFLAFGAVMLFFGIEIGLFTETFDSTVKAAWRKVVVAVLGITYVLYAFSFMYMFGNAAASQKEYETYLAQSMMKDIEELSATYIDDTLQDEGNVIDISIVGTTPYSNETKLLNNNYPALEELVPIYISNSWWIGGALLQRYSSASLHFAEASEDELEYIDNTSSPDIVNLVYEMYMDNNHVFIKYR